MAGKRIGSRGGKGTGSGGNAQTLRNYWENHPTSHGKVSGLTWGVPGDFMKCVHRVEKFMAPEKAKGYCALRHRAATGEWPGPHAHGGGKGSRISR